LAWLPLIANRLAGADRPGAVAGRPSKQSHHSDFSAARADQWGPIMSKNLVEDALSVLRAHGLAAEVHNGGHYKLKFTNKFGVKCTLVVSRSPSNRNAHKSNRAQLRRLLRSHL